MANSAGLAVPGCNYYTIKYNFSGNKKWERATTNVVVFFAFQIPINRKPLTRFFFFDVDLFCKDYFLLI